MNVNDQKNHYWAPCWQTRLCTIIFTIIKTWRCDIIKIKRLKIKAPVQSSPNFSECYSSLGFIHCRTEGKHYDTPKHTLITRCRNKCNLFISQIKIQIQDTFQIQHEFLSIVLYLSNCTYHNTLVTLAFRNVKIFKKTKIKRKKLLNKWTTFWKKRNKVFKIN